MRFRFTDGAVGAKSIRSPPAGLAQSLPSLLNQSFTKRFVCSRIFRNLSNMFYCINAYMNALKTITSEPAKYVFSEFFGLILIHIFFYEPENTVTEMMQYILSQKRFKVIAGINNIIQGFLSIIRAWMYLK